MKRIIPLLLLAAALLWGCAGRAESPVSPPEADQRLTVATSLEKEVWEPLVLEFEQRTGIWTEVVTGTAPELMESWEDKDWDLVFGCEADLLAACSDDFLPCPVLPEALSDFAPAGERYCPVSLRGVVLIYNPILIRQNPPTGFDSLLDPAWQGHIAFADPEQSDFGRTVLEILILENPGEDPEEVLARFAGNLGAVLPDTGDVIDSVADGSCRLAVVPEDAAERRLRSGGSLTVVYPSQGAYRAAQGCAIFRDAPHRENGEAFLRFLLSRDVQRYALEESGRGSVLADLAEGDGIFYDAAAAGERQEALLSLWEKLREAEK